MTPRHNPFNAQQVDRLPFRFHQADWPTIMARMEDLGHRASIVGPRGSGKTTFLDGLEPRLADRGWRVHRVSLTEASGFSRRPTPIRLKLDDLDRGDIVLLDGVERLSPLQWWRLRRRTANAGGLVVTAHRRGRLPIILRTSTHPALLEDLIAALAPRELDTLRPQLAGLFAEHRGNLRLVFRDLYDLCADPNPLIP